MRWTVLSVVVIAGCNQPPGAPLISISPAEPFGGDDLTLVFEAEALDRNARDTLTYEISWQRNGTDMPDFDGLEVIPAVNTGRGQRWTARVYAWDGKLPGETVEASVAIQNSVPQLTEVRLEPSVVRTDGTLTARYNFVDADDDLVEPFFNWRVDGTRVDVRTKTLEGRLWFDKGDRITVGITLSDLDSESDEMVSDEIVVENTPPGGVEVAISPDEPSTGDDIWCRIATEATDVDADTLEYRFEWTVNGRTVPGGGTRIYPGDTLTNDATALDDVVECTGYAWDGDDQGPSDSASVEVKQSVVPGFSGEIGPTFPGWLQCSGYYDVENVEDIPDRWADRCAGAEYDQLRLVCGASDSRWRSIDVSKNVFRVGLTGFPEEGLISNQVDQDGRAWTATSNYVYAAGSGNNPSSDRSWWVQGSGCGESNTSLTINNFCTFEAANCFGQGLTGPRYLYVYVAP